MKLKQGLDVEIKTRPLTEDEIKLVNAIYATIHEEYKVDKKGGATADFTCCRRLRFRFWNKKYDFVCINGCALRPHVVAFMKQYKKVRTNLYIEISDTKFWPIIKVTLSHSCGDCMCIEPTHLWYEPERWNLSRKLCHFLLRKWVKEQRTNESIDVTGSMTISRMQMQQRKLGLDVQEWNCYHDYFGGCVCFISVGWRTKSKRKHRDVFSSTEWNANNLRKSKRIKK